MEKFLSSLDNMHTFIVESPYDLAEWVEPIDLDMADIEGWLKTKDGCEWVTEFFPYVKLYKLR